MLNIQQFIFAVIFLCTLNLHGQQLTYHNQTLHEILQDLESKTDLSFNYEPSIVSSYTYSGTVDLSNIEEGFAEILKSTPLAFEIINDNILILTSPRSNYKICGWVKDKNYNNSLPAANIYLEDIDIGTLTDDDGYFEINLEAYKNQIITISYIGYEDQEFYVEDFNKPSCTNIELNIDEEIFGSEIVIRDYMHQGITEGVSYNSTSIHYPKTIKSTGQDEHDVLKTVQILPGITSLDGSAGNLSIRGSTSDQNMLVWERATLYDSGHMFGMISTVNPFVLEKVNVYKGVFDPKFDNRIGGLIEMSLPTEIPSIINGGFGSTLSEVHAHLSAPIIKDKLAFIISGRRSFQDIINSPTINRYTDKIFQRTKLDSELTQEEEDYRDLEENIKFSDINLKLFYQISPKLSFKSSMLFSKNEFESYTLIEDFETIDDLKEETWAFSNELSYKWNNKFTSTLFLVDSDYSFQYESETSKVSFEEDEEEEEDDEAVLLESNNVQNNINDLSIGISNTISLNQNSRLNVDVSIDVKDVKHVYEETSDFEGNTNETGFGQGLFTNLSAAYEYNKDKFQFMIGTKASYYHQINDPFISPRISLQYLLKKGIKLKASTGKMYQFISQLTLNEDNDLGSLRNFWVMANENSDEVMNSDKFAFGLISNHKGWLIDLEAYYNKSFGLSSLTANLNAGVNLEESGESSSMGIEMLIKKQWHSYTGWLNYTLSKNKYFFPDADMDPFPANNDHRHNLSFVNSYNYKGLLFSLNYSYRSGLPYSIPNGIIKNESEDGFALNFEQLNNFRLKSTHRLDASLTYQRPVFKNKYKAELSLSVINLMDARNAYTRDSLIDGTTDTPIVNTYDKYLLRRTPKFLFRIYW